MNREQPPVKRKMQRLLCLTLFLLNCFIVPGLVDHAVAQETGIVEPGMVLFKNPLEDLSIETPTYRPIPGSNFLGNSNVYLQDSKGFIWMMWQGSLYRFDGYQLKGFGKVPTGTDGINAHYIQAMAEDEFGCIWMGCLGKEGLYRYDPRKETFERFPRHDRDPQEISDVSIWSLSADMQGSVWIGTADFYGGRGLYRYDCSTDSFDEFRDSAPYPTGLPTDDVHHVYADRFANVWVTCFQNIGDAHPTGLYHFNIEDQVFRRVLVQYQGAEQAGFYARMIREDEKGNLWLTSSFLQEGVTEGNPLLKVPGPWESHVRILTDSTLLLEKYEIYPEIQNCEDFDIDLENNLWLSSGEQGILRFDPSTGRATHQFPADLSQEMYPWFFRVICDNAGSVWFGYSVGISIYVPGKRKFTEYDASLFSEDNMDYDAVYSVCESENGSIWIGLRNTLVHMDPLTLDTKKYRPVDPQKYPNQTMKNRGNPLKAIAEGPEGDLLVAGDNHLFIFQIENGKFESIEYESASRNMDGWIESYVLVKDRFGKVWIGANPGCLRVDLQDKAAKSIFGKDMLDYFALGTTVDLVEDNRGMLWMGTNFGLRRYDPVRDTSVAILFDPGTRHGLSEKSVTAILKDRKGNLWLGFQNGGIGILDVRQVEKKRIDPESLVFSYLNTGDGLPDLHIHDLAEDHSGNIWIASRTGISCFEPETRKMKVYTESDGIDVMPFTSKFFVSERTGRIYIGGASGLLSFHPDSIPVNPYVPPVVITELKLHDKPVSVTDTSVLRQSISFTQALDLTHDQNFLEFTFAALDYTDPFKNQYKYLMNGVDPDTVYAGTQRTAVYRDMKPGNYTFWVTGSNNDGIWNKEGTSLQIRIRPPWYRSPLASGSYALMALLVIAGIIGWRTSRLRKEKLILEAEVAKRTRELQQKNEQILEMEQLKTRFFTDVSHEIRTPLTLITGPLENLLQKPYPNGDTRRWLGIIRRNSKRLMHLVNQLLDISRLDAGQMKLVLVKDNLIRHLGILVLEYYSLAESRGIRFITDIPEMELITWYDREKVEKVVTNLLSNAFKYTPDQGTITFRVKLIRKDGQGVDPAVRIIIADTGRGIPESDREKIFERFYRSREAEHGESGGTGIGLTLTRELVRLMKGEIDVRSLVGKGTVFIVTIPTGKSHLGKSEYVEREEEDEAADAAYAQGAAAYKEERETAGMQVHDMPYELLIVEDNEELRKFIHESLSDRYRVTEAGSGAEGVELALEGIPDLVISDVMMPGMDGMELCNRLKADERTSHIPVILLTARATSRDRIEGLEQGADDYISKPFDMNELKVRVRNLLIQREKLKEKYAGMVGLDWSHVAVTTLEEKFLKKVFAVITGHMHDSDFNVRELQENMAMSRVNLFRKLKALTGETPSGLIRSLRLKTAALMLEKGSGNITHIALETGFSSSSIFASAFKKEYGLTPREYRNHVKTKR